MASDIKGQVRERYGAIAREGSAGSEQVAHAMGYSPEELRSIPSEANLGLSCGNPTAIADLRPGQVVLDLGSGGGLDVFLAAQKVGPQGKAIGVDMTADMIARARVNAEKTGVANVEFHLADIESMPIASDSVDVVISNCVLNLVPDKDRAFAEILRVLRPGGRLVASDIALKKPLPPEIGSDVLAYVGCVAGAILIDDYRARLNRTGFVDVDLVDSGADLTAYAALTNDGPADSCGASSLLTTVSSSCCSSGASTIGARLADLMRRYDINAYAASVHVRASKPM